MTFSPTETAFEGFRITREKPLVLLAWAGLYLVVSLFTAWLAIKLVGPDFAALQAAAKSGTQTPAEAAAMLRKLGPLLAVALPITLALQSVLLCAVYRVVLRPDEQGFAYLKFGGDELRIFGLTLVLASLGLGVVFAMGVLVGVAAALTSLLGPLARLIDVLIGVAAVCVVIWGAVRLSLAGPLTFATGEIHVFRSWPLTRGRFWPLLGSYVLAWAMGVVVMLLAFIIFGALTTIGTLATGGSLQSAGAFLQPDMTSAATFFTPTMLVYSVFSAVLRTVVFTALLAPPAAAYAALAGARPAA